MTADKAVKLQITYYSGEKYTIATTDGSQRLTISGGKPVLASPAADNNQFWVIYGSTSSGYTLQNVGTKQYVTVTVTSKEVTEDGSDVLTRDERVAAMIAAATSDEEGALGDSEARFNELLAAEALALTTARLEGKTQEEIASDIAAMEKAEKDFYDYVDELNTLLSDENAVLTPDQQNELAKRYNAYISAIEKFTGKKIDEIIAIVAEKLVDEQMAAEAEAPKPSTTVTTYTVGLTDESAKAARWALNKLGGTDDWTLTGLFYPGCDDSDAIGGTVTHHLTDGNSSFPLRGVISCTKSISSVTVEVKGTSGEPGFTVTGSGKGNWFDLWELDKSATFSSLKQGTYKLTIYGRNASGEVSIWSDSFTVGAKDSSAPAVKDDTYTVTFKNGSNTVTRTYKLGDTYGTLPTASGEGFQGWFTDDGEQIFENSIGGGRGPHHHGQVRHPVYCHLQGGRQRVSQPPAGQGQPHRCPLQSLQVGGQQLCLQLQPLGGRQRQPVRGEHDVYARGQRHLHRRVYQDGQQRRAPVGAPVGAPAARRPSPPATI